MKEMAITLELDADEALFSGDPIQQHSTNLIQPLVRVAATALVVSSIGFGAIFAAKASIHGGILLAGLAVLMATALEAIKPSLSPKRFKHSEIGFSPGA